MNPTIEVEGVSFQYEDTLILEEISFSASMGEFVAIFGPNGGGKTTFLQLLMGFLSPLQGNISILAKSPHKARSHIGYVPQVSHLDRAFPITAIDVVLMGCLESSPFHSYSCHAKERAREALAKVGLASCENHKFGTLSGGEAQRILFARALVSQPSILLLDEPTANVDLNTEETMYQLLEEMKPFSTILMVTHDLETVLQRADRCVCINRNISTLSPATVCNHFTQGLYHAPLNRRHR